MFLLVRNIGCSFEKMSEIRVTDLGRSIGLVSESDYLLYLDRKDSVTKELNSKERSMGDLQIDRSF